MLISATSGFIQRYTEIHYNCFMPFENNVFDTKFENVLLLVSTWNQTHFSPIVTLLSDYFVWKVGFSKLRSGRTCLGSVWGDCKNITQNLGTWAGTSCCIWSRTRIKIIWKSGRNGRSSNASSFHGSTVNESVQIYSCDFISDNELIDTFGTKNWNFYSLYRFFTK